MDDPEVTWENQGEADGPPMVSGDQLEKIEAESRQRELSRLLEMGVLEAMDLNPPEEKTPQVPLCLRLEIQAAAVGQESPLGLQTAEDLEPVPTRHLRSINVSFHASSTTTHVRQYAKLDIEILRCVRCVFDGSSAG